MSIADFKRIFWLEYIHRMMGRTLGLYYIAGAAYVIANARRFGVTSALRNRIFGFGALIGV